MRINNYTLINYNNILESYVEKHLPQKISFAITKNLLLFSNNLEAYKQSLQKIYDAYNPYFVTNDDGNIMQLSNGLPQVDEEHLKDYFAEIDELLNLEVDIDLYHISDSVFDYEDDKYDALSPADIIMLSDVICKRDMQNSHLEDAK